MALPDFTMRQLLEAGVHFGHQTHRWNPKMESYIYGARNGIHIIDLAQTVPLLHQALVSVRDTIAAGGRMLLVGTKRQASEPVAEAAIGQQAEAFALQALPVARATAEYSVYFGQGRDSYDLRGRTAHESLFNAANGTYRGPSSQQGYSPFSTWTRGLAWAMLGYSEQLEWLATRPDEEFATLGGREAVEGTLLKAASATCSV